MYYVCAHVQDGRHLLHAAAVSGNEELVHMLIEDYGVEPSVSPARLNFDFLHAVPLNSTTYMPYTMPPKLYYVHTTDLVWYCTQ